MYQKYMLFNKYPNFNLENHIKYEIMKKYNKKLLGDSNFRNAVQFVNRIILPSMGIMPRIELMKIVPKLAFGGSCP